MNTKMGASVSPLGWSTWSAGTNTALIFYGEYKTKKLDGTAYDVSQRVAWSKQISDSLANTYLLDSIFSNWKPCDASPLVCGAWAAPIAVTNFKAVKGTTSTPSVLTWNASWAINGVKYELFKSSDNKVTFASVYSATATNDTAIVFGTSDTIPLAGKSFFYIVKGTKTGLTTHISDTIEISSVPTISMSATTLGSFLQGVGLPSNTQSYLLTGVNLLNPVTVTPPANYQISNDAGATWKTSAAPLSITPQNGTMSNNILVRLNATAAGTYSGNITHVSVGAVTTNVAVTGTTQATPLPISNVIQVWSMAVSNADSTALRAAGLAASVPTFSNMTVSNGTTVAIIPPYSALYGQAFGTTANGDGSWGTAAGGPGGNLNRSFYVEYKIAPTGDWKVRVDSMVLNASFYNTASNTKMAVLYSFSGFTSDSAEITGGIGADGLSLSAAANGAFATPILLANETAGTTNNYRLAFNGATGLTVLPTKTLTIRLYLSCGSSSTGRYAKFKDVFFKGLTATTTKVTETAPSVFSLSPNPVSDVLTLKHAAFDSPAVFSVYDLAGKKVLSQKANGGLQTQINVQQLANGVYLIECLNEKGGKSVEKFVKQ